MADQDSEMTRQQYRDSLAREHPQSAESESQESASDDYYDDSTSADSSNSRAGYAAESAQNAEDLKIKQLARKLNWAILGLSIAIVIVFLILFLTP